MHQFSIHAPDGEHLGFLVMLADDETAPHPEADSSPCKSNPPRKTPRSPALPKRKRSIGKPPATTSASATKTATTAPTSAKNGSSSAANTTNSKT